MNCAIHKIDSNQIKKFLYNCRKIGPDYIGSNGRMLGINPKVFSVIWTEGAEPQSGKISDLVQILPPLSPKKLSHIDYHIAMKEREFIAGLDSASLEKYIDESIVDLPSAKNFLKRLSRAVLAISKISDVNIDK